MQGKPHLNNCHIISTTKFLEDSTILMTNLNHKQDNFLETTMDKHDVHSLLELPTLIMISHETKIILDLPRTMVRCHGKVSLIHGS
jgi:hypothetical protein